MSLHLKCSLALPAVLLAVIALSPPPAAEVDKGVIRLEVPAPDAGEANPPRESARTTLSGSRRAFDFESFQARLEGLWFERKALIADGREADAARQSDLMKTFCSEEGIERLPAFASALIAEARRYVDEGSYEKALRSLDLADTFDPGRAQIRTARAAVYWKSGGGVASAASEWIHAVRATARESWRDLTLANDAALLAVVALLGCVALFGVLSAFRHHVALRHDVAEALAVRGREPLSEPAGVAVLLAPILTWVASGWAVLYWIPVTFRHMRRGERAVAALLLVAAMAAVPAYRLAVGVYGLTADPVVRTTVAAAAGGYDPERIVEMREIVEARPDEPIYRFLLAGLYKDGRYFDEAYEQYKKVLTLEPSSFPAWVNLGNIFFQTGQFAEASGYYKKALEARPDSVLAYFDLHLAQSEAFNFKEAEASLHRAREIDPKAIADLLSRKTAGERPSVVDAQVGTGTILKATLEGSKLGNWLETGSGGGPGQEIARQFLNPLSFVSFLSLVGCGVALLTARKAPPALRCTRCGRPFCHRCRSGRETQDYCTQCIHLFVLGDGLAPETKTRKLYEIERHEKLQRFTRRALSVILPGAGHILRGRVGMGTALMFLWLLGWLACEPGALVPVEKFLGADLRLDLLRPGGVPASFAPAPLAAAALPLLAIVWLAGNLRRGRKQEA